MKEYLQNCMIQELKGFSGNSVQAAILRIDLLHPVVSGNKWFKLHYYLQDALLNDTTTLATFGGAYSNHIVATAFATKEVGLKSIGFIRGEMVPQLNATLLQAVAYGMELKFIDRTTFRNKQLIIQTYNRPGLYWVMEGGYGRLGASGAADILKLPGCDQYTHIVCAAGTGTMMAGLIKAANPQQEVIGISVLKNHHSLENEVRQLLTEEENRKKFSFIHGYHFGGYAKHPETLIHFMKETWFNWQLPTDIVYTSKLLFAARDLVAGNYFPPGSNLLVIHSGGLQGNHSLPFNTLPF